MSHFKKWLENRDQDKTFCHAAASENSVLLFENNSVYKVVSIFKIEEEQMQCFLRIVAERNFGQP